MADHRFGQSDRNHLLDVDSSSRDLCLHSESPLVQQILLHQKLKKEINRKSGGRVRYIDSELHTRINKDRSPNSVGLEPQLSALNSGGITSTSTKNLAARFKSALNTSSNSSQGSDRELKQEQESTESTSRRQEQALINKNCQVCLIREVRQDLMNIDKMVQEHNEQISKLKAKFLRSYFERQMMEQCESAGNTQPRKVYN